MKNLYRFNQFLNESSVGDFAKNFSETLDLFKPQGEKKKEDKYSVLKDSPLVEKDKRKDLVGELQDSLVKLGNMKDPGKSRGTFGGKTLEGVKKYQKSKNQEETGKVNYELMKSILEDSKNKK
jgi:peptidoglycan hydrolase-like protein with peptidoglycan-binding domain